MGARVAVGLEDTVSDSRLLEDLSALLNKHSMENGSNTADFILAAYLLDCLAAFDKAMMARDKR